MEEVMDEFLSEGFKSSAAYDYLRSVMGKHDILFRDVEWAKKSYNEERNDKEIVYACSDDMILVNVYSKDNIEREVRVSSIAITDEGDTVRVINRLRRVDDEFGFVPTYHDSIAYESATMSYASSDSEDLKQGQSSVEIIKKIHHNDPSNGYKATYTHDKLQIKYTPIYDRLDDEHKKTINM